jgi:hypothetical protein
VGNHDASGAGARRGGDDKARRTDDARQKGDELNMAPRLSTQARRALIEIGSRSHGATEDVLTLSGFKREMLARLVGAGLVTVVTENVGPAVKVDGYRLTDEAEGRSKRDAHGLSLHTLPGRCHAGTRLSPAGNSSESGKHADCFDAPDMVSDESLASSLIVEETPMIKRLVIPLALIVGCVPVMAQSTHPPLDPVIVQRVIDELRLQREQANDAAAAAGVRAKVAEAKAEQLADEVQKLKAELEKAKEPRQ